MIEDDNQQDVLLVDESFAVVRKRIGEVCETSGPAAADFGLIGRLRPYIESMRGGAIDFIEAVHRLDRPVSGTVLIALNQQAFTELSRQFAEGKIRKRYIAVVENPAKPIQGQSGTLEHWLTFDTKKQKAWIVPPAEAKRKTAKKAVLDWEKIGEGDRYLFLAVEPRTGRTHQIRAQLAAIGLPIKGDLKYGAKRSEPGGGIRLHAQSIQFTSPRDGSVLTVSCPPLRPDALWNAFLGLLDG